MRRLNNSHLLRYNDNITGRDDHRIAVPEAGDIVEFHSAVDRTIGWPGS